MLPVKLTPVEHVLRCGDFFAMLCLLLLELSLFVVRTERCIWLLRFGSAFGCWVLALRSNVVYQEASAFGHPVGARIAAFPRFSVD